LQVTGHGSGDDEGAADAVGDEDGCIVLVLVIVGD